MDIGSFNITITIIHVWNDGDFLFMTMIIYRHHDQYIRSHIE